MRPAEHRRSGYTRCFLASQCDAGPQEGWTDSMMHTARSHPKRRAAAGRLLAAGLLAAVAPGLGGCGHGAQMRGSETGVARNPQRAAELTHQATPLIGEDPGEATRLLRAALDADLYYGPAHNNLGIVYLNCGQLYEAAEEFDWARRLMPGHPAPRINLGIALERGGKIGEALDAYASAIEVYPNHLPAMEALTRLQLRSGQDDAGTRTMLEEIAYRGDKAWKKWANSQLTKSP